MQPIQAQTVCNQLDCGQYLCSIFTLVNKVNQKISKILCTFPQSLTVISCREIFFDISKDDNYINLFKISQSSHILLP